MSGHIRAFVITVSSFDMIEIIFRYFDMIDVLRNRSFSTSANSSIAFDSVAEENRKMAPGDRGWKRYALNTLKWQEKTNLCECCKKETTGKEDIREFSSMQWEQLPTASRCSESLGGVWQCSGTHCQCYKAVPTRLTTLTWARSNKCQDV